MNCERFLLQFFFAFYGRGRNVNYAFLGVVGIPHLDALKALTIVFAMKPTPPMSTYPHKYSTRAQIRRRDVENRREANKKDYRRLQAWKMQQRKAFKRRFRADRCIESWTDTRVIANAAVKAVVATEDQGLMQLWSDERVRALVIASVTKTLTPFVEEWRKVYVTTLK